MLGFHIVELQKKLLDSQRQQHEQQIQLLLEARQSQLEEQHQTHRIPYYRMRTAAINEAVRRINEEGFSPEEAAYSLKLSLPAIHEGIARMEERDVAKRRFHTGVLSEGKGGYLAITK